MEVASGILTFDDVLSREECNEYIAFTERTGYEAAPTSTGPGICVRPEIRNNSWEGVDHAQDRDGSDLPTSSVP
jgi:hypothetical protein